MMRKITNLVAERNLKDREPYNTLRERWFGQFLSDSNIPPTTKVALVGVALHFNQEEYSGAGILRAYPSERTLERELGMDRRTIRRALKKAEGTHINIKRGFREGGLHAVHQYSPILRAAADAGHGRNLAESWAQSCGGVGADLQSHGRRFVSRTSDEPLNRTSDRTSEGGYASRGSEGQEPSSPDSLKSEQGRKGWPGEAKASPQGKPEARLPYSVIEMEARRRRDECSALRLHRMRLDSLGRRLQRFAPEALRSD